MVVDNITPSKSQTFIANVENEDCNVFHQLNYTYGTSNNVKNMYLQQQTDHLSLRPFNAKLKQIYWVICLQPISHARDHMTQLNTLSS